MSAEGIEFGLKTTEFYVYTVTSSAIVLGLATAVRLRSTEGVPKGLQNMLEAAMEMIEEQVAEDFPEKLMNTVMPFLGTFFFFILISNWMGLLPGAKPPTADLSMTAALGVWAVLGFQILSVRINGGWGAFKQWFKPVVFFAPLKLIDNFARTLSLSLRLFGNIQGEFLVHEIVAGIIPLIFPVILSILGFLVGIIQAVVFTILSMKYLAEEVGVEREEAHAEEAAESPPVDERGLAEPAAASAEPAA